MRKFIIFFIKYNDEQNLVENVQVMEPEKAQDYISFMDATWTKGQYARTTHVMGASEALQYVIDTIEQELKFQLDDAGERINNLLSNLKECYGIDYKPNN